MQEELYQNPTLSASPSSGFGDEPIAAEADDRVIRWDLFGIAAKNVGKKSYREVKARTAQYYFDRDAAERAIYFIENQCRHFEGEFAGQPFVLSPWQRRIVRRTFGWKWAEGPQIGTRVVREVYIEVPRKNGKSTFCAAFAAYLLFADQEMGAQVISAAADTKQAGIVYRAMKEMVFQNPLLQSLVGVPYKSSMGVRSTASTFQVLSSKPDTKHGLNLHGGIIDELHAHKDRELVDVLTTSTSSRRQPLIVQITTAGHDRQSICWEKHEYALGIIDGDFEDDSFYGIIFGAEEGDDWTDPKIWAKANPNLGISKRLDYLERECRKAQRSTDYENTFKQLELNIWTEQARRWMPMNRWDSCATPVDREKFKNRPCFIGMDLSKTTDLTAMCLIFPTDTGETEWIEASDGSLHEYPVIRVDVIPYFWVPEANLGERSKAEERRFRKWIKEGFMRTTPGGTVDYKFLRAEIEAIYQEFDLREIAFDPWNATQLTTDLDDDGFVVIPIRQGYASLSAPSKHLMELVLCNRIAHGGHPVLRWCAGNVAIEQDAAGNIKPSKDPKKGSKQKIDGMIALITGLARVIAWKNDSSIYEERGIVTVG